MCINVSYPHKTAALCAGCILQCTCRLWWLGRWGDTAGNSLHCYCCRDWCLGTRKHEHKYTKQIKEELQRHKQMCFGIDKQATWSKQKQTFNETWTYFLSLLIFMYFLAKSFNLNMLLRKSWRVAASPAPFCTVSL